MVGFGYLFLALWSITKIKIFKEQNRQSDRQSKRELWEQNQEQYLHLYGCPQPQCHQQCNWMAISYCRQRIYSWFFWSSYLLLRNYHYHYVIIVLVSEISAHEINIFLPETNFTVTFLSFLIILNVQNSGKFSLASQVEMSLMAIVLVFHQTLMLIHVAMIVAGSPGRNMTLNGQMVRLNLNWRAQGMCLDAVYYWILKMKCQFSSPEMDF
jgi:hypothetical protein